MSGQAHLESANGLTKMQDLFVKEFHLTNNATQSAIKAGSSEKSAPQTAQKWLRMAKVQQALSLLQRDAVETYGIDKQRIVKELMTIAYGRIADCLEWDKEVCRLKPKDQLTDEQLAYIDSISFMASDEPTDLRDFDGNVIYRKKFSIAVGSISKQKVMALKTLAQISGLIKTDSRGNGSGDIFNTQNNLIFVAEWGTGAPIKKVTG